MHGPARPDNLRGAPARKGLNIVRIARVRKLPTIMVTEHWLTVKGDSGGIGENNLIIMETTESDGSEAI